jgi:uncharacterized membrane protein
MKTVSILRTACFLLLFLALGMGLLTFSRTTIAVVASSLAMFALCVANAGHLFGKRLTLHFVLLALTVGWFVEQMGATQGWFFGAYSYTDVLGWRIGAVPVVIPLMWFALSYIAYVLGNLIVLRSPIDSDHGFGHSVFMSLLAAMLVTAFDLGADPYFVNVLKAWVMVKKDGWWFGETLQGFVGWFCVSFVIQLTFRWFLMRPVRAPLTDYTKWHSTMPLALYASGMVFQIFLGDPVETRTVALFAMGIPTMSALAAWFYWVPVPASSIASPLSDARLDQMQYIADPLADNTMERILKDDFAASSSYLEGRWQKINAVNAEISAWTDNASIEHWQASQSDLPETLHSALQEYLSQAQILPSWADHAKIDRAEALFMDYGPLSCTLLFCASLPECYVIPDLSAVLHATGQLDHHTNYRVRATAAMIFPVMMKGGLSDPNGGGVAQILKVRLIHATIRHLLLRACPATAMADLGDQLHVPTAGIVEASSTEPSANMSQTLFAHGWKLGQDGLPCNQEELAYTLLTFGYVFLRSMRQLGMGLSPSDEVAYLHCWNVVGHLLGIRKELMPDSMVQAQAIFTQMQARGRAATVAPDPRPLLGRALMDTVSAAIPLKAFQAFPILLARHLCGSETAKDIGINRGVSWMAIFSFQIVLGGILLIDQVVRLFVPNFSLSRMLTRVLGYHMMSRVLMSETRQLKLPGQLLIQVRTVISTWGTDSKASPRLNALEDRLTTPGNWYGN